MGWDALYLWSDTLISLMRESVKNQPKWLKGISRSSDKHQAKALCRLSPELA